MKELKVCVIGSGAREHALWYALSRHADVVVAPGNAGMEFVTFIDPEDFEADLFVIGPEQPLVDGEADRLRAQGKNVFGPGADGAQIEGSKGFMKELVDAAGVATADYRVVTSSAAATNALVELRRLGYPGWAIKTDGLAAGKGVFVTTNFDDAQRDIDEKLAGKFGEAGKKLVIEGLLASKTGVPAYEVSLFAICNGTEDYVLLEGAQDYKLLNADSDLNTGGMGAYSPTRDQDKLAEWGEIVVRPVLRELLRRGIDYRGVLYFGLMIVDGMPYVLEINIRFGDPEAGVILPRITGNFAELLRQAAAGEPMSPVTFSSEVCAGRVLAAENYPGKPRVGDVIEGLERADIAPFTTIFCAGVSTNDEGRLVTAGGRVLLVVAWGQTAEQAITRMNETAELVTWPGIQSRPDIGQELLAVRT